MSCVNCPPPSQDCDCPVKDLSMDCIIYNGTTVLTHIGTNPKTLGTQVLINIDNALGNLKDDLPNYFRFESLGAGAEVYKGISNTGIRQIRSLVQGTNIILTENENDITFDVPSASDTVLGSIEIATQAEVDAAVDALKAVTPSTLGVYVNDFITTYVTGVLADPANLPSATETSEGVVERATVAEVLALSDATRYISPLALSNLFASQIEVDDLMVTDKIVSPGTLPIATDSQLGLMEFATVAEANALSVTDKALTPGTLPTASESQAGTASIATQATVDTGTNDTEIVTPLKLKSALDDVVASFPLKVGMIMMWSGAIGSIPTGWALCDGTSGTPNLSGRFIVGYDSSDPDYNAIGNTGGLKEVTLTIAEMPSHSHSIDAFRDDQQSVNDGSGSVVADQQAAATVGDEGGDQPHENRPPYYTLAYIIYTG